MDRDVGRIRALLEELRLDKDTLIVFSSDNGPTGAGGQDIRFFNSNGGLRGEKRSLYEGGIRVPTVAWWPGAIRAGTASDLPSIFCDWLPTFADLAGAPLAQPVDGVSLAPTLRGRAAEQRDHDVLFWDYNEGGVTSRFSAARKGKWKLVVDRRNDPVRPELYDLSADPAEMNDVAAAHPDVANELLALMKPWWR
jgi:arylsulfatase A-like enzyme